MNAEHLQHQIHTGGKYIACEGVDAVLDGVGADKDDLTKLLAGGAADAGGCVATCEAKKLGAKAAGRRMRAAHEADEEAAEAGEDVTPVKTAKTCAEECAEAATPAGAATLYSAAVTVVAAVVAALF